jgi:hypothetical protein
MQAHDWSAAGVLMDTFLVCCAVFAVVIVAEQVSLAGRRLFTTVLPILRSWLDDANASHDALGQLLAGNPAIGMVSPQHMTLTFPLSLFHTLQGAHKSC